VAGLSETSSGDETDVSATDDGKTQDKFSLWRVRSAKTGPQQILHRVL
jgi:hypothetical protein